jgi:maltooligosyltrehalose trehalohydrolase
VANGGLGSRLSQIASPGELRALTALLLLAPGTPLLFQGQEFGSSACWVFFADHRPELAQGTWRGRREFVAQFPSLATPEVQARIPDPGAEATFRRCKLQDAERERNAHWLALHRDLIGLRTNDPAFAAQRADCLQGAVLGERAFVLRYAVPGAADRLVLFNLGGDLMVSPCPEPLLAPPAGKRWRELWSSEALCYGGEGVPATLVETGLRLRGRSAVVLGPAA